MSETTLIQVPVHCYKTNLCAVEADFVPQMGLTDVSYHMRESR